MPGILRGDLDQCPADVQTGDLEIAELGQIDRLLFQERLVAPLSGFFGLLALVLACVGLYGLLSYEVSGRTREIGIRMALGAQPGSVLKLILLQGIVLAITGAIVGIGVTLGVTRYLASMLYDVRTNDPLTMVAVAALLTLVALAACYIPARRAMRVDPMVALRYEKAFARDREPAQRFNPSHPAFWRRICTIPKEAGCGGG